LFSLKTTSAFHPQKDYRLSTFNQFPFSEKLLKLLDEIGYKNPTKIQELAIPKILEGNDILASAQTGTGKTAAFLLPSLHLITQPSFESESDGPHILVLVPTRELAMQVAKEADIFTQYLPLSRAVCIYGGVPYPVQRRALSNRYEILVATPGRLMDHMQNGLIDLSGVKMLILDEADRMLDMGFAEDVQKIADACKGPRQTLLFSATIDKKIIPISKKLQKDPVEVTVEPDLTVQSNIEQKLYYVDNIDHKIKLLDHILENNDIYQSIIFTSTKSLTDDLADYLSDNGYLVAALHGEMSQRDRTRTINKLRYADIQFLIATDVAARGIDVPGITHVINFDLPFESENFVHRIGRTGRAGAKGIAITFSTYKEERKLERIYKLLGKEIEQHSIPGMEPQPKPEKGFSTKRRRGRRRRASEKV